MYECVRVYGVQTPVTEQDTCARACVNAFSLTAKRNSKEYGYISDFSQILEILRNIRNQNKNL